MDRLEEKIMQNKEDIEKALHKYEQLAEKYGKDHDETIKQREQINTLCANFDILFQKIGKNGWTQAVRDGIEELKERIVMVEKSDIERKAEITLLNTKLDVVIEKLVELSDRPKEKRENIKTSMYFVIGSISILSAVVSAITWFSTHGGL